MSQSQQKYLLVLSIGPVQGFIAAARKTRDLWFGSHLLSEVSKAAAKAMAQSGELVFPGIENDGDLNAGTELSVANIVIAVVDGDVKEVLENTKQAATDAWENFAATAKWKVESIPEGSTVLRENHWQRQIDDFLEFQAAWTPLHEGRYKESRDRVMRLLAGRKTCRDFLPAAGEEKLPKSSLDGARETVLHENLPDKFRTNLHLRQGEQLDAIGVVKRFAGGRIKFRSLGLIAIDPVIRNKEGLDGILSDENIDWDDFDALNKKFPRAAEKSPYLAVLLADGDRMGKAISGCTEKEQHRDLSKSLAGFAKDVPGLFKKHHGVCVYSGGDDVFGFLPLDEALQCARELHERFATHLVDYSDKNVSLSVGLVVGHYHEMLENLIEYARKAESEAKRPNAPDKKDDPRFGDRNGLAVWTYHRSGSPCGVRER